MSYCRFSEADVYVYTSRLGIECCMCSLEGGTLVLHSNEEMIQHLEEHELLGDYIPDHVFDRLRDPADAAENEAIWQKERDGG